MCFYTNMFFISFSLIFKILKFVLVVRIIQYGTINICRQSNRFFIKRKKGATNEETTYQWYSLVPFSGTGYLGYASRVNIENDGVVRCASHLEVTVYTLLPLRVMSRIWGTLTTINIPVSIRPQVFNFYVRSFGVDLSECTVSDLSKYRSLSEFFNRSLKPEFRPVDPNPLSVVSPADGRILSFGKITSCKVDQVKGVTYTLQQFLGEPTWVKQKSLSPESSQYDESSLETSSFYSADDIESIEKDALHVTPTCQLQTKDYNNQDYLNLLKHHSDTELYQIVVYLAPGDYHKFHSPVSWNVVFRRHFPGYLLSVNPAIAGWIRDLFSINERAMYCGSWEHGFFSLTAVGATNVGSIKVGFDPTLQTNTWIAKKDLEVDFLQNEDNEEGHTVQKGQLFGEFRLGSTVVLVFEAPKNFTFNVTAGQRIKYGQCVGSIS